MIKIGVVGLGGRVSGVLNNVMRDLEPDVRITALVDPDREGAVSRLLPEDRDSVVFYDSLDEMVRRGGVDALAIGTRCNLHTPYAMEAARYDLPLFLEKPVAVTMDQAVALEKAFATSRCRAVVSFPLRVTPLCAMTRTLIEEGAVGRPEHILAVNYVNYGTVYFDNFYRDFSVTRGLFLQKATHDLDYMMYLMGGNIVRLAAMASFGRVFGGDKPAGLFCSACAEAAACLESPANRRRNTSSKNLADHPCVFGSDIGTPETGMNEDASSCLVEFDTGAQGVYTQVFYSRRDAGRRGATVSGYDGTLSFNWNEGQLKRVRHHAPFSDTITTDPGMSHFGGDHELMRDFIALIKEGAEPRTPIRTGIQSCYTCLAAQQSAAEGRFVAVPQAAL